jgi:hypothetical protein
MPDRARTSDAVLPARVALDGYSSPVDAIRDEHLLQRACFVALEKLAAMDVPQPVFADAILATLQSDTPIHIADEELSLFPRLRARAEADDDMETLLATLSAEHSSTRADMQALIALLSNLALGGMPGARGRQLMIQVAALEKKHLVLENAVLLPLAAARLTKADKEAILAEMRARRAEAAQAGSRP